MPKRKEPEESPDKQFERFKKTARELQIDDEQKPLEEAFKKFNYKVNHSSKKHD